ncbi:MAG: ScaI family restriction endonuclease [Muribaculaceae bacterium]|nr:ScaI family restriction endonuclease [Muribaculaceae bacterium]
MKKSPYDNKPSEKWRGITEKLINKHPLKEKIVKIVLQSWDDIFNSKIGSFSIGKEILPSPQIMSFLLHELVAHYLSLEFPGVYKVGEEKHEKDIHNIIDPSLGIEIKASSNKKQIFGNRSYAQPSSSKEGKDKNGYYIAINFDKFSKKVSRPKIKLIRFGYIEHTDWIAQTSETGQQARLKPETYSGKFITLYDSSDTSK